MMAQGSVSHRRSPDCSRTSLSDGTAKDPGSRHRRRNPASAPYQQRSQDAAYSACSPGTKHAVEVIRERAGKAFDPEIANAFADEAAEVMAAADAPESAWETTLAVEPKPWLTLQGKEIDQALAAMGDFADLLSPFHSGHSAGVANLAVSALRGAGSTPSTWSS